MPSDSPAGRDRAVAYVLGNVSGLGLALGILSFVFESHILALASAAILIGAFGMFWHYPWDDHRGHA